MLYKPSIRKVVNLSLRIIVIHRLFDKTTLAKKNNFILNVVKF